MKGWPAHNALIEYSIAQHPEPFEGGVFGHGFVEAHFFGGLGFFGFGSFFKSFVA
jgi:hypothetical protein